MLKIAFHSCYEHPLKEGHRFPMEKYDLLHKQLLHEGTCTMANFFEPNKAAVSHLLKAHSSSYVNRLLNLDISRKEERATGFPLSQSLIDRELIITQGTIDACHYATKFGMAMNIAGGTHHAFSGRGEAFCLLNDQAIAASYLLNAGLANRILIIDLDVHQGNGTAEIFKNISQVFTFSMHGASNYPFQKEKSDLDIPLENGTKDELYLSILKETLPKLIETQKPNFLFYQCGVDILASDKLGKLDCSIKGCMERDRFVLEIARKQKLPLVCCMGGGYSPDVKTIIDAHANTYRLAQDIFFG